MFDFQQLAISFLIPGLFVWGSTFFARRSNCSCRVEVSATIGIAIGLFALRWLDEWNSLNGEAKTIGQSLTLAAGRFWLPKEARDWLALAMLTVAPLIVLDHAWKRPRWLVFFWGALAAVTLWRFLLGSVYLEQWTTMQLSGRLVGVGLLVATASLLLGIGNSELQPRGFLKRIIGALIFGLASAVAITSGSISGGMIGLVAAAAFGHAAIAGLISSEGRTAPISSGFWIFSLTAVLSVGVYFSEITTANFLMLIVAAGIAGFVELRPAATRFSRLAVGLAVIGSLGFAVTAAGLSLKKAMEEMQKKSDDPYSSMN